VFINTKLFVHDGLVLCKHWVLSIESIVSIGQLGKELVDDQASKFSRLRMLSGLIFVEINDVSRE